MLRSSNNSLNRIKLNSNRNSSTKKANIKPSALLFYQTPTHKQSTNEFHRNSNQKHFQSKQSLLKSSRQNLSHVASLSALQKQNQKSRNNFQSVCLNHPNSIAQYISCTGDGEQIQYCSKCAQLLVDQGFNVQPICFEQQSESINYQSQRKESYNYPYYQQRFGQIKNFESRVENLLTGTNEKTQHVKEVLMQSEEFYGQQIEQITNYFQQIIQELEFQKNKCYNHILKDRAQAQEESRNILKSLMDYQKQLSDILNDIEQNIDEVYTVQRKNYQMVLDSFVEKVETIQYDLFQKNGGINIKDIELRKIEFMGVPNSINSLSEIILKSCGSQGQGSAGIFGSISLNGNTQKNQEQNNTIHRNNSLMFSFDGQKMKSYSEIVNHPQRKASNHGYDQNEDTVKCKHEKQYVIGGIKQVEVCDEVEVDDDLLYCQEIDQ